MASGTVLPVLLYQLGMTKAVVGLIGAIESLGGNLFQIVGLRVFRRRRGLKFGLIAWHLVMIVPIPGLMALLLLASGRLSPGVVAAGLLIAWALFWASLGVAIGCWIDWLGHVFPPRIRGIALGLLGAAAALANVAAALVASWLVGLDSSVAGYARHYALATLLTGVSMVAFWYVRDPVEDQPHDEADLPPNTSIEGGGQQETAAPSPSPGTGSDAAAVSSVDWTAIAAAMASSLRDPPFRNFLVGRTLGAMGLAFVPFVTIHYLSPLGGNLSEKFVVGSGAAAALGTAAGNLVLGRLGDRRGHRLGLILAIVAQCAALVVAILVPGAYGCLGAFALAGMAIGGVNVSGLNLLLETCPHAQRQAHIIAGNLALAGPSGLAPLLAGLVGDRFGSRAIFALCLLSSLAGIVWLMLRFVEPRRLRPSH